MEPTKIIGNNIKLIREQKGIKQELLGKHIGVTKGRMSQIESGDCDELSLRKINKIALFLETDFFVITRNNQQNDYFNNCSSTLSFVGTQQIISPELIKAIADELITRIK